MKLFLKKMKNLAGSRKFGCILFTSVCILCLSLLLILYSDRISTGGHDKAAIGESDNDNDKNYFCNLVKADKWLKEEELNQFGDALDTMYAGGSPIFDESTGKSINRYDYLTDKFPSLPWMDLTCDKDYPDCKIKYPSRIADGNCDGGDYDTPECGYDGGDCT